MGRKNCHAESQSSQSFNNNRLLSPVTFDSSSITGLMGDVREGGKGGR